MLILQRLYYGEGSEVGRRNGGSLLRCDWADRLMKQAESRRDGGRTCPFSSLSVPLHLRVSFFKAPPYHSITQPSIHLFIRVPARLSWRQRRGECTTRAPPLDGHWGRLIDKNKLRVRDKNWWNKSEEGDQSRNEDKNEAHERGYSPCWRGSDALLTHLNCLNKKTSLKQKVYQLGAGSHFLGYF